MEAFHHHYPPDRRTFLIMPRGQDAVPSEELVFGADLPAVALFYDLCHWREQLARSIARNNLALQSEAIATAANRILGRLLILRIAQDRELISPGIFQEICEAEDQYGKFCTVFPGDCDPWADTGTLLTGADAPLDRIIIDPPVIRAIVTRLAEPGRKYDFSRMETDTVALVLSRYLRQTVRRSAAHQATIVDTHETVLSGSVEELSLPVIEFMVQGTLDAARAGRSCREILPLRVLDPACGTGRVLLAAFRYLAGREGGSRLTFDERRDVLRQSLHGVDIDRHAVAITKMLLVFRLCEDLQPHAGVPSEGFFAIMRDVLCDLDRNLRCGNALVGPEIKNDESWAFSTPKERHSLNLFSWNDQYPEIYAAGGFDAVIGNPPDGPAESREWIQQYYGRHYATFHPRADRSALFVELGVRLLRGGGSLGYVMSGRFLRLQAGSPLRVFIKAQQPEEIVSLSGLAGERQPPGPCIVRLTRTAPSRPFYAAVVDPAGPGCIADLVQSARFPVDPAGLDDGGWVFCDTRARDIREKVCRQGTPLEDFVMGQVSRGFRIRPGNRFIITEEERRQIVREDPACRPLIRPLVTGADIRRYHLVPGLPFVICIPHGWTARHPAAAASPWRWLKKRHPALARCLKQCAEEEKPQNKPGEYWWEMAQGPDLRHKKQPRILFATRSDRPAFAFDLGKAFFDHTVCAIEASGYYLPGILNSRLMSFVLHAGVPEHADPPDFGWDDLKSLPIYTPDFDQPEDRARHDRLAGLIQEIHELYRHRALSRSECEHGIIAQEIGSLEKQANSLVYGLYGLTVDEIAVVESRFLLKKSP